MKRAHETGQRTWLSIFAAALAAASAGCASEPANPAYDMPMRATKSSYMRYRAAPPLDPDRRIVKRDCTKPVLDDGPNLVCE